MGLEAIKAGHVAVVTGGAAGLGLAAAKRFAAAGMAVVVVDLRADLFADVEAALSEAGAQSVLTRAVDVSDRAAVAALRDEVFQSFGRVDVLMCNAGIQPGSDILDAKGTWARIMDVNLGGVVTCCQTFLPDMIAADGPGLVINTGSKQGITTPPGDPAYNTAKAGVKVFTEALAHHLREVEANVTAHLFVPGFVFTQLSCGDRSEKPAGAWTADQTVAFLFDRLAAGDFYVICPDNDVTRAMDEKRMAWAMGDIIENRPPLSRWHKDWAGPFAAYMDADD